MCYDAGEGSILWRWTIIEMKNRDQSLKLEGLQSAQNRLSSGHPVITLLSSKQASIEAGRGGEERVAEVLRNHPFPFDNHIFHDLSPRQTKNSK